MMKAIGSKSVVWLAHGFGLGLAPVASGTFGTLLGIPLCMALQRFLPGGMVAYAFVALLLAVLAVPVCEAAEQQYRTKDDGRIVADEYLAFPICFIGIEPLSWPMLVLGFLLFRLFDILKPAPARQLQSIPGGAGIVIDDVFAAFYTLASLHALLIVPRVLGLVHP